ncbi:dihydropteroate synthase [Pseudaestuariivita atlantica]|uniref:Dihydropteroate synthase n=1 Tax=Pseudaestuariivita atlantica TaxID=1317121 RepID=A0A0L1JUR7_9RHOB|nr:dihydropteroate synthase [Pseudaestuariivita atlantica]KNG95506.1 dihydropteroate synthase [Pseudaestuariivita atlantica]
MSRTYIRPLVQAGPHRPDDAQTLAGGRLWFTEVLELSRGAAPVRRAASGLDEASLRRLTAGRGRLAGLDMSQCNVMGILNVTPDSFSDGGLHAAPAQASRAGRRMVADGAHILDIGGESTRPGAEPVPVEAEIARIEPVMRAVRHGTPVAMSIDTRKRAVAEVALAAGAGLINDVSGFTHDPELAVLAAERSVPVCLMHARGDPQTMQNDPRYDDVLLDVYDFLEAQVAHLESLGLPRCQVLVDPGIGFGKTVAHNLALLEGLALFHSLGCPILLGASRKGFIGRIGETRDPTDRLGGSVAVALSAAARGAQVVRVHDVKETAQALKLWRAVEDGGERDGA